MKQVTIRIKISKSNFGFALEKSYQDNPRDLLVLSSILDIIKQSQLEKIGRLERKEIEKDE